MKLNEAIKITLLWADRSTDGRRAGAIARVVRFRRAARAELDIDLDDSSLEMLRLHGGRMTCGLVDALLCVADLADRELPSIDIRRTRQEAKLGFAASARVRLLAEMLAVRAARASSRAA